MTVELKVVELVMFLYGLGWLLFFVLAKVQFADMKKSAASHDKKLDDISEKLAAYVTRDECHDDRDRIAESIRDVDKKTDRQGERIAGLEAKQ